MIYIGYFGKLPEKGDFIQDGISMDEREAWDAWLQQGIVTARKSLADSWEMSYVYRASWRFLASDPAGQRSGVLLFSHDRVGREFPFLVLFGAAADSPSLANLGCGDIDVSLAFTERLVGAAFDGVVPVGQLATLLQNLPWRRRAALVVHESDGVLSSYAPSAPHQLLALDAVVLQAFLGNDAEGQPRSLWWRCAEDGRLERVLLNQGPLSSRLFGQLLAATQGLAVAASAGCFGTEHPADPDSADPVEPRSGSKAFEDPAGDDDDPVDFNSLLG